MSMMRIYSDLGVMQRPGLSYQDATSAPDLPVGAQPGMAVAKMVGEQMMVPQYAQLWWSLRNRSHALFVHAGPKGRGTPCLIPDLRVRVLDGTSQDVALRRLPPRRGESGPPKVEADWTGTINIFRGNGLDRVDLAFRDFGIVDVGVPNRAQMGSYEYRVDLAERMINPYLLAMICLDNDIALKPGLDRESGEATRVLNRALKEFDRRELREAQKELRVNCDRWRDAFAEAIKIVDSGADPLEAWRQATAPTPEQPAEEPEETPKPELKPEIEQPARKRGRPAKS